MILKPLKLCWTKENLITVHDRATQHVKEKFSPSKEAFMSTNQGSIHFTMHTNRRIIATIENPT